MTDGKQTSDQAPISPEQFDWYDPQEDNGLLAKAKKYPGLALGIVGALGYLGYSVNNYRKHGAGKQLQGQYFLLQLRVKTQGILVGCLVCSLFGTAVEKHFRNKKEAENNNLK